MMATNCPQKYKQFYFNWSTFISHLLSDMILFVDAFAKLRRATIGFIIFVRREQLYSQWRFLNYILYFSTFRQCEEKIKVSLKFEENNVCYT
jgi:hypothetical protein